MNRRIRTRTYGDVGGEEPRGFPLSRLVAWADDDRFEAAQRFLTDYARRKSYDDHMQYRGVTFDIKVSIERGAWVWVVHTPKPRQGKFTGNREEIVLIAKRAIDAWCLSNPRDCDRETSIG